LPKDKGLLVGTKEDKLMFIKEGVEVYFSTELQMKGKKERTPIQILPPISSLIAIY